MDGPAFDTDPNVAYAWGYGLSGSAASHARLEKITLPGGREIYYNYWYIWGHLNDLVAAARKSGDI